MYALILAVILVIVILLVIYWNKITQLYNLWFKYEDKIPDDDTERLEDDPKAGAANSGQLGASDTLTALGYNSESVPWDEVIQVSELDPATFINHKEFVKDVRRFSSGANFTSVTDDNTNAAFTNFVGLRRPEHVDIGSGARQVPDIDESVLKRSKVFRWNSTS